MKWPVIIGVCIIFAGCASHSKPLSYTLNRNTPFEENHAGTSGLLGKSFFVNKTATYRNIRASLIQGQHVTVTQVRDGGSGVVLVKLADDRGRPLLGDWYSPGDLGLMTAESQAKWQSQIKTDCGTDALATLARNQQIKIGMSEACAGDAWGPPYRVNVTATAHGASKQMIYVDGYIYSENGTITAIQQSQ